MFFFTFLSGSVRYLVTNRCHSFAPKQTEGPAGSSAASGVGLSCGSESTSFGHELAGHAIVSIVRCHELCVEAVQEFADRGRLDIVF